jgi:hypothetical protein
MIPLSPRQSRGKIAATAGDRQAIFLPGDSAARQCNSTFSLAEDNGRATAVSIARQSPVLIA